MEIKYCTNCGVALQAETSFCSACGTKQENISVLQPEKNHGNPAALTTLCILTIIGSVLGMLRGLFYEAISSEISRSSDSQYYLLGFFSMIVNAGTLTGAVFMLNRKAKGYNLYMICQVIGILIILFRTIQFTDMASHDIGFMSSFSFYLAAAFIVPSVVFMVLYSVLVKQQLS